MKSRFLSRLTKAQKRNPTPKEFKNGTKPSTINKIEKSFWPKKITLKNWWVFTPTFVSHKPLLICTLSITNSWIEGNYLPSILHWQLNRRHFPTFYSAFPAEWNAVFPFYSAFALSTLQKNGLNFLKNVADNPIFN